MQNEIEQMSARGIWGFLLILLCVWLVSSCSTKEIPDPDQPELVASSPAKARMFINGNYHEMEADGMNYDLLTVAPNRVSWPSWRFEMNATSANSLESFVISIANVNDSISLDLFAELRSTLNTSFLPFSDLSISGPSQGRSVSVFYRSPIGLQFYSISTPPAGLELMNVRDTTVQGLRYVLARVQGDVVLQDFLTYEPLYIDNLQADILLGGIR